MAAAAAQLTSPYDTEARYEFHRVWVIVRNVVKPGQRRIYSRRTFYVDEDSR
jgi:hypothetical protein